MPFSDRSIVWLRGLGVVQTVSSWASLGGVGAELVVTKRLADWVNIGRSGERWPIGIPRMMPMKTALQLSLTGAEVQCRRRPFRPPWSLVVIDSSRDSLTKEGSRGTPILGDYHSYNKLSNAVDHLTF